jgi:hypothetical protein
MNAAVPRIQLDVPPGFTGLPLSSSDEDNSRRIHQLAMRRPERSEPTAEQLERLAASEGSTEIRLFGRFAVGGEHPSLATVTLATVPLPARDTMLTPEERGLLAEALLEQYRDRHPEAEVKIARFPLGPAIVAVVAGEYRLPPEVSGGPAESVIPSYRVEFQLPTPDGLHLIFLGVRTETERDWPLVVEHAVAMARSIRLEPNGRR